jgi:putative transposase
VKANQKQFPVQRLCQMMAVSTSGYYAWLKRLPSRRVIEDTLLLAEIRRIHAGSQQSYGYRRILRVLIALHHKVGRDRVARLMRQNGIAANRKRRRKSTTHVTRVLPEVPNLLNRNFVAKRPNAIWVSDISYVRTGEGWLYLAVVIDLYARRIVGWAASSRLTQQLALNALHMAIKHRRPPAGLIHHSDRGSQYTSQAYRTSLTCHRIQMSMSKTGSCFDNAVAESFFSTLKCEWLHHQRFATRQAARSAIFYFIEVFYNRQRLHSTLNYVSPLAFENTYYQSKGIYLN